MSPYAFLVCFAFLRAVAEVGQGTQVSFDGYGRPLYQEGTRNDTLEQTSPPLIPRLWPAPKTLSPSANMSVTADFASGTYTITNSLHHNNAALVNHNADEPLRGILPVGERTFRDSEKVSHSVAANRMQLNSLLSGSLSVAVMVGMTLQILRFRGSLGVAGADILMAKWSNPLVTECFGSSKTAQVDSTGALNQSSRYRDTFADCLRAASVIFRKTSTGVTRGSASNQEGRQHTYSNVEVRQEGRDLLFNLLYLLANNVGASVYPFLQNIV